MLFTNGSYFNKSSWRHDFQGTCKLFTKGFSIECPLEWFGHGLIEVFDKFFNLVFEVLLGGKVAETEQSFGKDFKPDFHLVEPRTMLWRVDKISRMSRIRPKSGPAFHVLQDAVFPLFSQFCFFRAHHSSNPTHQCLGLMGVEVIQNDAPLLDGGIALGGFLDMPLTILLVAGVAGSRTNDPAVDHIPVGQKKVGAMTGVFELPFAGLANVQWQVGCVSFQRLHPGLFIHTDRFDPFFCPPFGRLHVHLTDARTPRR